MQQLSHPALLRPFSLPQSLSNASLSSSSLGTRCGAFQVPARPADGSEADWPVRPPPLYVLRVHSNAPSLPSAFMPSTDKLHLHASFSSDCRLCSALPCMLTSIFRAMYFGVQLG
eukprot:1877563-Pleurochrysis_carterae.AAC.1